MSLFEELRRRNVFRVAVAYVVTAWLLMQFADLVLDNIGAPAWVMQTTLLLLAIGFPVAVLLAWAFEITPEGIKRERDVDRSQSITYSTGRKLDFTIIALLLGVAVYFIWEARFADQVTEQPLGTAASPVKSNSSTTSSSSESAQSPVVDDTSIAVLPFVNLSSDPEQEFFSDGISEELLNVLAQFPDLRVAARTSSFQFKGDNRDISEIAKLLKVNHVLEGSVRKSGTRLRITAQLIEADNGYHLWSETYDRELEDIFAIQDEISAAIGKALRAQLQLDADSSEFTPRVIESSNTTAYEAYLHGRHLINQRGNRAITEAVRHLKKSIRLDPNFAPAHIQLAIGLALLHNGASSYGDLTGEQITLEAMPHIQKAEMLNPNLPELWGAKAQVAAANNHLEDSSRFLDRAIQLNPAYIDALNWRYNIALTLGEFNVASQTINTLIKLDPFSIVGRLNYTIGDLVFSNPLRAREVADDLSKKNLWVGYSAHGIVESTLGNLPKAIYWLLKAYAVDPLDRFSNQSLTVIFAGVGMRAEALRIAQDTIAQAYWQLGEFHEAEKQLVREIEIDPSNVENRSRLADLYSVMGNSKAALEQYDWAESTVPGLVFFTEGFSIAATIRYSVLLQESGRHAESESILDRARRAHQSKLGTAYELSSGYSVDSAIFALLELDYEIAIEKLQEAAQRGGYFNYSDPILAALSERPQYQALKAEATSKQAANRKAIELLVCTQNPIPESWQPLQSTCQ